ncbi:MAG: hypothetical protein L0K86_15775 [Actinomycetia bacterium]|nr:hypothetical protein [Actinomycetes bacterium]
MTPPLRMAADFTTAVEVGDWARVILPGAMQLLLDEQSTYPLVHSLGAAAASMRCQARGDVESAVDWLHEAAEALPDRYRRRERRPTGRRWYANLTVAPDAVAHSVERTTWRLTRVIAREQAGIAEHEAVLLPDRLTSREVVELACCEFLRWVGCDPFLPGTGAMFTGIDMEVRCSSILRRATDLRRLVDPMAPDIGTAIWRAAKGSVHLQSAAYARLARSELLPRRGPGALPPDVPVRFARVEAYRRACQRRDGRVYA